MRPYTRVNINGTDADLPPNFSFTLSYAIRDRQGFATNTGTRSDYSFTLPATKVNDGIANGFWNVGLDTEAEQEFLPANIEINGMPFFSGKAQLRKVDVRASTYYLAGDNYHYAFFGNNADWVVESKNALLKDLPFDAHTFDNATILAAWNNVALTDNYAYILLKTKDWPVSGMVQFTDCTPVIFVASAIDYHFANLGYTLSSNFFDSLFFRRLVMPILLPEKYGQDFSEGYINIRAEFSTAVPAATYNLVTSIFDVQTQTPTTGPNPYNTGTGVYTVPYDGFYQFRSVYDATNVVGTASFLATFVINGAGVGLDFPIGVLNFTSDQQFIGEFILGLNAGDTIEVVYTATNCDLFGTFEVTGEADIKAGTTIDFQYIIPKDWKVIDMIKGISHAFNLVWETDAATKTITVEPSDSYLYTDTTSGASIETGFYGASDVDKTNTLDLLRGGEVKSNSERPQEYILAWKEDSNDPTVSELNVNEELKLHEARYTMPENRFKNTLERIENPFFAPTLQLFDRGITHEDSPKIVSIPMLWSKDYVQDPTSDTQVTSYVPRLLVFEGIKLTSIAGGIRLTDDAGATYVESFYPYAYFVDYNDTAGETMPLSFNNITVDGIVQTGLLERFYTRQFARYRVGKELECFLFWTATDLNNLTFRELIDIRYDRYILQEVSAFNPMSDEATRTYLLYNAADEQEDYDAIDGSLLDGKIIEQL